ncbi:MAG: DNA polymerase [Bacteroidales bacterium]
MNCAKCGRVFTPRRYTQKYCCKECRVKSIAHKARSEQRHCTPDLEFISVDGEGVTRFTGQHDYVMLSVGDKTLWNNGKELTYKDIYPFLYERFLESPNAAYVGYFLSYDFLQWTKHLKEEQAHSLFTTKGITDRKPKRKGFIQSFPVIIDREWDIDILANRRFRLRPHVHSRLKNDPTKCYCGEDLELEEISIDLEEDFSWDDIPTIETVNSTHTKWMYICDTGPFWQCSFLSAINPKAWPNPIVTAEEYETLKSGKANRGVIADYEDVSYYEDMRTYNVLENKILSRLTATLNEGFCEIGVKIPYNKWFGPGQAASLYMRKVSDTGPLKFTRAALFNERVPKFAEVMARKTYYGGWFEQFMHGFIPGVTYEYDINSAYPYIISRLPCLHSLDQWTEGVGTPPVYKPHHLYMLHVEVEGSDPHIGCVPFRTKSGSILRVHHNIGWYWKDELDAGIEAGVITKYRVLDWVSFREDSCQSPLKAIEGLYKLRLEVGKNSPQGKALKLLYNSIYGKFAQSIGSPLFGNPVYASLITSGCRSMILKAIASHPTKTRDVTMVATDGIYFRTKHPSLDLDPERLGAWDMDEKINLTQFMPGLYWDDKVRDILEHEKRTKSSSDKLPLKTRGVNVRDLADSVMELDRQFHVATSQYLDTGIYAWPQFRVPVRFDIVSPGQALNRGKWCTVGTIHGEEHNPSCPPDCTKGSKILSSNPISKRSKVYLDYIHPVFRTNVYKTVEGQLETFPYEKLFGEEDNIMTETITPDGGQFLEWFFKNGGTGE